MKITIDGQETEASASDKNIIEVAARANVTIPCACYRDEKSHGCCQACVVEIDGQEEYACATEPKDGMNITVTRDDLKELRKQRLLKYQENIKAGKNNSCNCE